MGNSIIKRLKYNRISHDVSLYHKKCKIRGIKEIDQVIAQIKRSQDKLKEIGEILLQIPMISNLDDIEAEINKAKQVYLEVEIDMEKEESSVKR